MSTERRVFCFSFGEHDSSELWDEADDASTEQVMTQILASKSWAEVKPGSMDTHTEPEERTLDAFIAATLELLVNESGMPPGVVQIPFDKLKELMADGGWTFVGGGVMPFEGNHNDTEIEVVLER
jgi:hypothetical protein